MILVTYKAPYELTVAGHAETDPGEGWSLVCACTTALVGGLCEALAQNQDQMIKNDICIKSGYGYVLVSPKLSFSEACAKMFEPTISGLRHLVQNYPEHIRLYEPV